MDIKYVPHTMDLSNIWDAEYWEKYSKRTDREVSLCGDCIISYCEQCDANYVWICKPELYIQHADEGLDGFTKNEAERVRSYLEKQCKENIELQELFEIGKHRYDDFEVFLEKNSECPVCGKKWLREMRSSDEKIVEAYKYLKRGVITRGSFRLPKDLMDVPEDINDKVFDMKKDREDAYKILDAVYGTIEARELIEKCSDNLIVTPADISEDRIREIKDSPDELSKYVWNAMEIEQSVFSVNERIEQLYIKLQKTRRNNIQAKNELPMLTQGYKKTIDDECDDRIIVLRQKKIGDYGLGLLAHPEKPVPPTIVKKIDMDEPTKPIHLKPGLFNKNKVLQKNAEMDSAYNEQMKIYEEKVEDYKRKLEEYNKKKMIFDEKMKEFEEKDEKISKNNEFIEKLYREKQNEEIESVNAERSIRLGEIDQAIENGEITLPEIIENKMVLDEIKEAEDTLEKLLCFREQYYSPNIVFSKYRDLSVLSMIYEYLQAGRCTELVGPNGAYNIYESELRANMIISKLDDVIERLDDIKQSQYTLCNIMKGVKNRLNNIDDKMAKACKSLDNIDKTSRIIAEHTEIIAHNTYISAYYAEKTAYYTKLSATVNIASFLGF